MHKYLIPPMRHKRYVLLERKLEHITGYGQM